MSEIPASNALALPAADTRVVYFSKMFQAAPHLVQVQRVLGGPLITTRRSTRDAIKKHYPDVEVLRYSQKLRWFSPVYYRLRSADAVITGSPYKEMLESHGGLKVTTFHGTYMAFGRSAVAANSHFDLLCVTGPRMKQMIARHQGEFDLDCVDTGFLPFAEFPERSPAQRAAAMQQLGLDPEKLTVLYTPSRKSIGSWDLLTEKLIRALAGRYNLVLRPHPSQALTPRVDDRMQFAYIKGLASTQPQVIVDLGEHSLPVLQSVADLVISDANSPAEESLFYDVPQLLVESPKYSRDILRQVLDQEHLHPEDRDGVLGLYDCGPSFRTEGEVTLVDAIEAAIATESEYRPQRQRYFDWVFGYRDRNAAQRVAAAVLSRLDGRNKG